MDADLEHARENVRTVVEDIRHNLELRKYGNEENVRVQIVLRILGTLGWNIWDPEFVRFEVNTTAGNARTDVFLHTKNRSVVIEVKKTDTNLNDKRFVSQLFKYNSLREFSIGFLSNGSSWKGYYFDNKSTFSDNSCFADFGLMQDEEDEIAAKLIEFLSFGSVSASGKGLEKAAREILKKKQEENERINRKEAKQALISLISENVLSDTETMVKKVIIDRWRHDYPKQKRLSVVEQKGMINEILNIEDVDSGTAPSGSVQGTNKTTSSNTQKFFVVLGKKFPYETAASLLHTVAEEICRDKGEAEFRMDVSSSNLSWLNTDLSQLAQGRGVMVLNTGIFIGIHGGKNALENRAFKLLKVFGYADHDLEIV